MPIRVGVVGVGYLGQHHARIYSELEDAELVAIVDIDEKRAGELADKYGCKAFSDYRDVFERVDALSIVTPTTFHHEVATNCLRAGKDLLIEKPITTTVSEADELINEAYKRRCILQVGHLERYNSGVIAVSELIKEPRFFESERLSPFLGRGTDVDVTLDLMIHDIDIILSLVSSPVKDLRAVGSAVLTDRIDVAKAWLEFENGAAALITASRIAQEKQRRLKIFQKDSYITLDYQSHEVKRFFMTDSGISSETLRPEKREPLKEELKDFIDCVKTRRMPRVSGIEGRDALKIALDITKILQGREINNGTDG